jgi:hypothetical protein
MTEAPSSSETSVLTGATWHNIPEEAILQATTKRMQLQLTYLSLYVLTGSSLKNLASQRSFSKEVKIITMIRTANKKLQQIQDGSSREGILVAATFVPQVRISFVVKHFIGCQVHACMEYLQ